MRSRSVLVRVFCILFVLALNSCFTTILFPDFWDSPVDEAFSRKVSPYPDSPDAVVLLDLEDLSIDTQEWDLIRERHIRIQIFTEEGKKHTNIRIPYWHSHNITEIKARTILPDGRNIPLKADDIFDEGDEKRWRYKVFAMPGVEDQCIIEYQYRYRETSIGVLSPKYFQGYLQTEYAKFVLTIPQGFAYKATTKNQPRDYRKPESVTIHLPGGKSEKRFTSEFRNIEPIKDEAYMYNREDHLFSVNMQMISYVDRYNNFTFIKEWTDMVDFLLDDFDSYMDGSGALRKLLAEVPDLDSSGVVDPRDIYSFVRDEFETQRFTNIQVDDMPTIIKNRAGDRVEKNLITLALFREAGYEADPVVISRRSNGKINIASPSIQEFDHVLVMVKYDGKDQLVDASARYHSWDLMPSDNYSGIGLLLVKGEKEKFVDFPATSPLSQQDVLSTCAINEQGELSGKFEIKSTGYYASSIRANYPDAKDDVSFAYENLVDHIPGIIVDSVHYALNSDTRSESVYTTVHFQVPDYLTLAGDQIYVPTVFYNKFSRNRLTSEERHHPVEFSYPARKKETINLVLPAGYEIIETPQNTSVRGPGLGFQKLIRKFDGGQMQLLWNYQLSKLVHGPNDYKELKNFYTESVALDQGMLVLKRQTP